jgi:hypothetical protein
MLQITDLNDLERRKQLNELGYWEIPDNLDTSTFDFTWRPFVYERPYIHQFGTQWQKTGGPRFIVPENEGIKYHSFQNAIKLSNENDRGWRPLVPDASIDFSWHPDETEPPYIYIFGNQWYGAEEMPTFQYRVKGATEKKYVNNYKATLLPNLDDKCWKQLIFNASIDNIDKSWRPNPYDPPYIHVFGNQWYDAEVMPTFQYRVKGATEKKYVNIIKATLLPSKENWIIPKNIDDSNFDYSWCPNPHEPPMEYEFGTQWQKTGGPKFVKGNPLGTKFVNFQKVTRLQDPQNRCFRPLKNNIEFDYSWHPDETEPPYIYVFGNQWYDAEVMPTLIYKVKGATEKKYINNIKAKLLPDKENRAWRLLKPKLIIDYSWVPNPFDPPYIYVFGNQWSSSKDMPTVHYKVKGATNYKFMDVDIVKLMLDEVPVEDSLFDALVNSKTETDYIQLGLGELNHVEFMPKLDSNSNIHIIDNTHAIVPKEAIPYLYDKLQDYPYIKYHTAGYKNKPLDIIFLSNGEKGAEENYEHLLTLAKGLPNNIIGLKDIKGRVASQHEAAKMASTPWYFLINGKCRVNPNFDFSWQPDRMCTARHYIFRATNPVNGLEYGHMAIVANNKRLTLNTTGKGLDFTLDSPHAVIDINSGIGVFNTSEWDTWRTAFREVIKLKYNVETLNDKISKDRLTIWLNTAYGDFAEYAIKGAKHAVEYYESVNGDFDKLKFTYDWEWLQTKFNSIRP